MNQTLLAGSKYRTLYERDFGDIVIKAGVELTMGNDAPRYKGLILSMPKEEIPQWLELIRCSSPLYEIRRLNRKGEEELVKRLYGHHDAIREYISACRKYKTVLPLMECRGYDFHPVDDQTTRLIEWIMANPSVYSTIGSVWRAAKFYDAEPKTVWRISYRGKTKVIEDSCDLTPHDITLRRLSGTDDSIYLIRKEYP